MDHKRKLDTEAIIAQALEEEEGRKRLKKSRAAGDQQSTKKGLTLHEVEAAAGGAIKESIAGSAHQKRSQQRQRKGKGKGRLADDDTELPTHVEEAEEIADRDQDDGMKLEPFNLAQEREEGFFDESGHYVERKPDTADETDAWLGSEDAAVVSESVRQQIMAQQRQEENAEAAPEMTLVQTAAVQRDIASILLPGETVTKGLKRLGVHNKRPTGKRNREAQPHISVAPDEEQRMRQQFAKLTESATLLLNTGDLEVYSQTREHLERQAARFAAFDDDDMFADNQENKPEPAPASTAPALASLLSTPRMSFSFPDMSSLDSNGGTPRLHPVGTSHGQLQPHQEAAADTNGHVADTTFSRELTNCHAQTDNAQTAAAQKVGKQAADPEVDYQSWPVKELRRFLSERGVDAAGLLEKSELAQKVKEIAAQGPQGEASTTIPEGYIKDDASGYFYNAENQMYYDAATSGFYSNSDAKWYLYDEASQQFQEWQQSS